MNLIHNIGLAALLGTGICMVANIFFMFYLGAFKVKQIDRLLYPEGHGIYLVFKGGGLIFGIMRAGDYGGKFLLLRLFPNKSWRFNQIYPTNIKLSDVSFQKQLPFMIFATLIFVTFLLCGIALSLRPEGA